MEMRSLLLQDNSKFFTNELFSDGQWRSESSRRRSCAQQLPHQPGTQEGFRSAGTTPYLSTTPFHYESWHGSRAETSRIPVCLRCFHRGCFRATDDPHS